VFALCVEYHKISKILLQHTTGSSNTPADTVTCHTGTWFLSQSFSDRFSLSRQMRNQSLNTRKAHVHHENLVNPRHSSSFLVIPRQTSSILVKPRQTLQTSSNDDVKPLERHLPPPPLHLQEKYAQNSQAPSQN